MVKFGGKINNHWYKNYPDQLKKLDTLKKMNQNDKNDKHDNESLFDDEVVIDKNAKLFLDFTTQ